MGFADSFCAPQNSFLPPPIPPPRSKRYPKPVAPSEHSDSPSKVPEENLIEDPLIRLEAMDEVSLFDPLKETNFKDADVFSFLAPKAVNDARVAELKNTIQNLSSTASNPPSPYFQSSVFYAPAQPGFILPRYPIPGVQPSMLGSPMITPGGSHGSPVVSAALPRNALVSQSNGISKSDTSKPPIPPKEAKPLLPPKTKLPTSRFFVPTSELTDNDKELLSDYGLSDSPIFQKTFTDISTVSESADWVTAAEKDRVLNTLDPLSSFGSTDSKLSPSTSKQESKTQPTWQKFN